MADILNLRCDAWLLPTDSHVRIENHWLAADKNLREFAAKSASSKFRQGTSLAEVIRPWDESKPRPVLTAVPLDGRWDELAVTQRIEAFVECCVREVPLPAYRPYRLLALPFFGTDGGGAGQHLGAALRAILTTSQKLSRKYEVDIVLVLRDRAAFSLAQKLRRDESGTSAWSGLDAKLQEKAQWLGHQARSGHVVPFLGAGVSVSAGAPTWKELLQKLKEGVELDDQGDKAFEWLPLLDQAGILSQLYTEKYGTQEAFGIAVSDAVKLKKYGLAPALLATLPSSGAITLNYDQLFEVACRDAQRPRTVLPEDVPAVGNNWLLKLHGSVSRPESIVLTRDDYLGYNTNRDALSALVKAHLLTHHLLFVGFGLADDHFHEIVHDVRRALPAKSTTDREMGTVLSLFQEPMQNLVWKGKLDIVAMTDTEFPSGDETAKRTASAKAGRELEVFLDMMAAYATESHSYLLSPLYFQGMTEAEADLRRQLLALAGSDRSADTAEVWGVIDDAMRRLGWAPDYGMAKRGDVGHDSAFRVATETTQRHAQVTAAE
ncbi:SIR2 family NAD-dependent protein deacylase [Paenarthrobacter sp. NyZ202]|uniref:SIR2 family NAD-dependent protein deacylase n=1 Tax=Paenarthrobacter sp. NyZ202 TaxID=3402689 RepID=UPI003CF2B159